MRACGLDPVVGLAAISDRAALQASVSAWFAGHADRLPTGDEGVLARLDLLLTLPGAPSGAAVVPILATLPLLGLDVPPLPTSDWPFPVQQTLRRVLRPDPQLHDYVTTFEAFVHLHFVALASAFYWGFHDEAAPSAAAQAGLAVLFEALTDRACAGGRAWLERAAWLSKACAERAESAPFPELVAILQPDTLALPARYKPGTQLGGGGPVLRLLRFVATLRNHLFGHWEALADEARASLADGLAVLVDLIGHLFAAYRPLRLALVAETKGADGALHQGIHGYWDSEQFLGISFRSTQRRVQLTWSRGAADAALPGFCAAPTPPRADWRWRESLLLFDPRNPYARSLYLMPFAFGYAHADARERAPLPGLLDSVRWQSERVRGIVQRTYTGALPREGTREHWQDTLDDEELALDRHPIAIVERVAGQLRRHGFSLPEPAIEWQALRPQFELEHASGARKLARSTVPRRGEVERILRALLASAGDEPQVTLLEGPSGSGKTVVLAQLLERLADGVVYLSFDYAIGGRAEPATGARAGGAELEAREEREAREAPADDERPRESAEATIRMHCLAAVCRLAEVAPPADVVSAEEARTQLRALLGLLAQRRQRVVVLADGLDQALGPEAVVAVWPEPFPPNLFLLCTSPAQRRVRDAVSRHGRRPVRLLELAPPGRDETRALLGRFLGAAVADALPEDVEASLHRVAAGLPIVLEFWAERLRPRLEAGDFAGARAELSLRAGQLLPPDLEKRLTAVGASFTPTALVDAVLWVLALVPRPLVASEVYDGVEALRQGTALGAPAVSPRQVEDCLAALGGFLRLGYAAGEVSYRLGHPSLGTWFVRHAGTPESIVKARYALVALGAPVLAEESSAAEIAIWARKVDAEDDEYTDLDRAVRIALLQRLRAALPLSDDLGVVARCRLSDAANAAVGDAVAPELRAVADDATRALHLRVAAQVSLGQLAKAHDAPRAAEAHYRAAIALARAGDLAAAADPRGGSALSTALGRLGNLLSERGEYAAAEAAMCESLAIRIALVDAEPSRRLLGDLAIAQTRLRSLFESQARFALACTHALAAVEVRERLARAGATPHRLRRLLDALVKAAWLLGLLDAEESAARTRGRAIELCARMEREAVARQDAGELVYTLRRWSALLASDGRTREALEVAQRCLERQRELTLRDNTVESRASLAALCSGLARRRLAVGDTTGALEAATEDLALAEALLVEQPTDARREDLATTLSVLFDIYQRRGEAEPALAHARRRLSLCEGLREAEPTLERASDVILALDECAEASRLAERHDDAIEYWLRALELRRRRAEQAPSPSALRSIAIGENRLAGAYLHTGRPREAKAHALEDLALSQRLVDAEPQPRHERDLSITLRRLAKIALVLGERTDAIDYFHRSTEVAERLRDAAPTAPNRVAACLARASVLALAEGEAATVELGVLRVELDAVRVELAGTPEATEVIVYLEDLCATLETSGAPDRATALRAALGLPS